MAWDSVGHHNLGRTAAKGQWVNGMSGNFRVCGEWSACETESCVVWLKVKFDGMKPGAFRLLRKF